MNKKLTAKIQKLNPKLPQYSNSFGQTLLIEPETKETLLKKGNGYVVFDISGESNFDTQLIIKVVTDTLQNTYFKSESISPIQSMEKALVEVRNKVTQLSSDVLTTNSQTIDLNVSAGVLWGNVLYVVTYGNGNVFTMKEGNVTPMSMISEGNFSTASKVLDEGDILIFCTNAFKESFPPEKLLSLSISEGQLQPNQICLLMRIIIDTTLSEDEVIDFGLEEIATKTRARERAQKITGFAKTGMGKAAGLLRKGVSTVKPMPSKVKSLVKDTKISKLKTFTKTSNRKRLDIKLIGMVIGGILISVLVGGGIYLLANRTPKETIPTTVETQESDLAESPEPEPETPEENVLTEEEQRQIDEDQKVERVSPEVFYDLKILDDRSNPSEIVAVGNSLIGVDRSSGRIYISNTASPSFEIEPQVFPSIKSITSSDDLLSFIDEGGYKTYDIETSTINKTYSAQNLDLSFPYANFIYTITGDILTRNTGENTKLEGSIWGQHPDFAGAKAMAIDFEVYILTKDSSLVSFSGGEKTDFEVTELEGGFKNSTDLVVDFDLEHIYVADRGNQSIVILNEDGTLLKQFKHQETNVWDDIRSIAVPTNESVLFVLNGSKIFTIPLDFDE